ncbi:MAG: thioredoxin family protein [Candidatus Dormibacteraeota bacterium]|nr:thioredoxin family protein [Candidatus Dormibacteraeota bacterium]
MKITLQYFAGCPHMALAEQRLAEVLPEVGLTASDIERQVVESPERALLLDFHGSPTVVVNGRDAFPVDAAPAGFACRVYQTLDGPQGAPTVAQLREVLTR